METLELAKNSPYDTNECKDNARLNIIVDSLFTEFCRLIEEPVRILDIGCGDGIIFKMVERLGFAKNTEYTGLDFQTYQKTYLKNDQFLQLDVTKTPYPLTKSTFDIVICTEVLEHLLTPEVIYKEAKRLLKDSGLFIVSTPNRFWLAQTLGIEEDVLYDPINKPWTKEHIRWFSVETHRRFLIEQNFKIEKVYGVDSEFCPLFSGIVETLIPYLDGSPKVEIYKKLANVFPELQHSILLTARRFI